MTFSDFWTNDNNPKLEQSEYLYNARHISVLVIIAITCIVLTLIFYKKSQRAKNVLFYVFGGLLLFFEIISRVVNLIIAEEYTFKSVMEILLPQYICSVMVWVFIVAIFTKKQFLLNYSVIGGLIATLAFLVYPAVGLNREYMSFTCLYSTISHSLGFSCAILLMTLKRVKFPIKQIWQPFVCLTIMFLWGALLTYVIFPGTDPMFLVYDPLELKLNFSYKILYGILLAVYTATFYGVYELILFIKKVRANKKHG